MDGDKLYQLMCGGWPDLDLDTFAMESVEAAESVSTTFEELQRCPQCGLLEREINTFNGRCFNC